MTTIASGVPAAPPRELMFRRRVNLFSSARTLWRRRELVWTLAERDLRARYKQATLGTAWALINPLALMLVFTVFFRRIADIDTHGLPYPLFAYLGLLPWTLFNSSVSHGAQSLISNVPVLKKVACPREVFPLAYVVVATVDMLMSLVALTVLFGLYGFVPRLTSLWVPVILVVQFAFTIGFVLILSSVVVYVRDVRHAVPLLLQIGLFATPVAYGIDAVPDSIRTVYSWVNPLAPVIDAYRRTVLLGVAPDWGNFIPGAISSTLVLVLGYLIFKKLERRIADVA